MRKTDITKYGNTGNLPKKTDMGTFRSLGRMVGKILLSVFSVCFVVGIVVGSCLVAFIYSMKDEEIGYDLNKLKLNYTSFIYVNDANGTPVEYLTLYSNENRVWVDFANIPQHMKDAVIAIEDKRFEEHDGVDWKRTLGAVTNLFGGGSSSYGGSTITQQLIKNVTGDKDVSLTRKVKEIFRALNLTKKYSRDQILETYLNVVSFGSGCNGVQAAANLYFDKDIQDCDIAECAAIAGITQNPSAFTPLVYPDNNKKRQQTVIHEMYDQEKITKAEYDEAMKKSESMVFVGKRSGSTNSAMPVWNWYIDTMVKDLTTDLAAYYNCSEEKARDMLYRDGLKIYSAMDSEYQKIAENAVKNEEILPKNKKIDLGYYAMDYNGRVLATVGSRGEKNRNLLFSYAVDGKRQPGSSIKPLVDYAPAMNMGVIHYSSILEDEPIKNWSNGKPGPRNFNNKYIGKTTVQYAVEISLNAPAVRVLQQITPKVGYNFLKDTLHFTSLVPTDEVLAMGIGGLSGVTVKEMTAGFQMFANGGKYNAPYLYYYVEDHEGNIILDHRQPTSEQAISSGVATVMHRLLNTTITGREGSGYAAAIKGWDVFGKTGTTNDQKDSYFVGGTPYALAGIWTGYKDTPTPMNDWEKTYAISIWKNIMQEYLKNKEKKAFDYDKSVVQRYYCKNSGKFARSGLCTQTAPGWYTPEQLKKVGVCNGHSYSGSNTANGNSSKKPVPSSSMPSSVDPSSSNTESTPSQSSSDGSGGGGQGGESTPVTPPTGSLPSSTPSVPSVPGGESSVPPPVIPPAESLPSVPPSSSSSDAVPKQPEQPQQPPSSSETVAPPQPPPSSSSPEPVAPPPEVLPPPESMTSSEMNPNSAVG